MTLTIRIMIALVFLVLLYKARKDKTISLGEKVLMVSLGTGSISAIGVVVLSLVFAMIGVE